MHPLRTIGPRAGDTDPSATRRKVHSHLPSVVLALGPLLVGLTGGMVLQSRDRAVEHATVQAQNLSRALEQHMVRSVEAADLVLRLVLSRLDNADKPRDLDGLLAEHVSAAAIGSIAVYDAEERLLAASGRDRQLRPEDADQRSSFIAHRDHPEFGLFIHRAQRPEAQRQGLLFLSRRIDKAGGGFGGIIIAAFEPASFQRFYETLDVGERGVIALLSDDGVVLARRPHLAEWIGRDMSQAPLFRQHLPHADSGHFIARISDGVERFIAYHRIAGFPFVLIVGLSYDEAMAGWRREAWRDLGAALVLAALAGALALALRRELRRRVVMEAEAREAARAALTTARLVEEKNQVLNAMLATMPDALQIWDDRLALIGWNDQLFEVLALDRAAFLAAPDRGAAFRTALAERGDFSEGDAEAPLVAEATVRNLARPVLHRRQLADGRWIEFRSAPIADVGYLALYRNVSEEVDRELKLESQRLDLELQAAALTDAARNLNLARLDAERARAAAEAANHAKSAFLAHMSHEIRTPMNGVLGMNALLMNSPLTAEQRRYASAIDESAKALLTVIDDILDVSKLEAGRVELEDIPFDVVETVAGAVDLLAPRAAEKSLDLVTRIAPAARGRFRGDPLRVRRILLNLLGNAIKFTERGSIAVEVGRLPEIGEPVRLRIAVTDTGTGIPEAMRARLFKKFNQTDQSITRRYGGTGLGLAICKQLVDLMGGEIGFESSPGEGSTFWFIMPLLSAGSEAMPVGIAAAEPSSPAPVRPVRAGRVLLVEDNRINRDVAAGILAMAGFRVDTVEDGVAALAALKGARYEVVLMDVQMPGLDGTAATRRLRALGGSAAEVPVIALTAHAMQNARAEYLAAGMDDYLAKPIDPTALVDMVMRWSGRRHQPVAPVDGAKPTLDDGRLAKLAAAVDRETLSTLVALFLDNTATRIEHVEQLVAEHDFETLAREAHDLASTAGNFGVPSLEALARRLEAACATGDGEAMARLVPQLAIAATPAFGALRARFLPMSA